MGCACVFQGVAFRFVPSFAAIRNLFASQVRHVEPVTALWRCPRPRVPNRIEVFAFALWPSEQRLILSEPFSVEHVAPDSRMYT